LQKGLAFAPALFLIPKGFRTTESPWFGPLRHPGLAIQRNKAAEGRRTPGRWRDIRSGHSWICPLRSIYAWFGQRTRKSWIVNR